MLKENVFLSDGLSRMGPTHAVLSSGQIPMLKLNITRTSDRPVDDYSKDGRPEAIRLLYNFTIILCKPKFFWSSSYESDVYKSASYAFIETLHLKSVSKVLSPGLKNFVTF